MPTIYIDMDGVVADWDKLASEIVNANKRPDEQFKRRSVNGHWPDEDWQQIRSYPHFYYSLEKTVFADRIMTLARAFRDNLHWELYMLTALPHDNDIEHCEQDKIKWMKKYYPDVTVKFGPYSHDKWRHAKTGDILVDDRKSNCEEWRDAGGIAVRVTDDYEDAIQSLQSLYTLAQAFLGEE